MVDRRKIIPRLIADYYTCFDHVYGELGVYTQDKTFSGCYWSISQAYRDSLYAILPPESEEYLLMREASFRDQRQYEEALKVNDLRLTKIEPYTPQYAMATYHRSLIYKYSNDSLGEKRNLCLSAISDIRSAIKDHASLWMLAQLLYEDGDMERAYQYMRFSWNATKFYNARLRSWQSADVLSLIDKTYQAMIEKQNDRLQQNLLLITALLVLLIVALGYIYRQMKKLADALPKADFLLSLMGQYTPPDEPLSDKHLNRRIATFEYESVRKYAVQLGLDGYGQERSSASSSYTPKFWTE